MRKNLGGCAILRLLTLFVSKFGMDEIIIDAKGKPPGRLATEIVRVLTGKDDPSWAPNLIPERLVIITNARDILVMPHRARTKVYRRHSNYPGGLKEEPFLRLFQRQPEEVVRRAVYGMLPKNRLRAKALKATLCLHKRTLARASCHQQSFRNKKEGCFVSWSTIKRGVFASFSKIIEIDTYRNALTILWCL